MKNDFRHAVHIIIKTTFLKSFWKQFRACTSWAVSSALHINRFPYNVTLYHPATHNNMIGSVLSPTIVYGAVLVQKVKHRHVLARNHFSKLSDDMAAKVVQLPLPRPAEKLMTSHHLATVTDVS